ncbi:MAG: segregation/condensation protein A [Melioribacteraceae bacterium]|nr:segregation/condensation protein A [Melioribacteraceae bacterium]MCF8264930.1 segregation/condensation protein A [Melioribacteraceae bacterium]MCF8413735.1 segregation/condensation protein A [Melioribacteraceae bacterium]
MYRIKLNDFEGPLDLLLFFIKRDELDIYDIPISRITKEFMDYLHLLEKLDLEIAGEFILMAATLMQIKVRMLLPKEKDHKGEEIDPRDELVQALLEYKRYKEMAEELSINESESRKLFFRGNFENDEKENPPEIETLLRDVTLYDLIKAFKKAMMEMPKEAVHQVKRVNVTIDEQIDFLQRKITENKQLAFKDLVFGMKEKIRIIVTFIALLEMVKMGRIGLHETQQFNDFVLYEIENG